MASATSGSAAAMTSSAAREAALVALATPVAVAGSGMVRSLGRVGPTITRTSAHVAAVPALVPRLDAPAEDALRMNPDYLPAHERLRRLRVGERLGVAADLEPAYRPRLHGHHLVAAERAPPFRPRVAVLLAARNVPPADVDRSRRRVHSEADRVVLQ